MCHWGEGLQIQYFYICKRREISIVHLESREREERNMTSLSFMTFFTGINSTSGIKGEVGKEYDIFIFYDLFLQE